MLMVQYSCLISTFITCLYKGNLIIIIRGNGIRKDAGRLAYQSFGTIGSAGGHKGMARAEIPFDHLKDIVDYKAPRKLLRWIIKKTG